MREDVPSFGFNTSYTCPFGISDLPDCRVDAGPRSLHGELQAPKGDRDVWGCAHDFKAILRCSRTGGVSGSGQGSRRNNLYERNIVLRISRCKRNEDSIDDNIICKYSYNKHLHTSQSSQTHSEPIYLRPRLPAFMLNFGLPFAADFALPLPMRAFFGGAAASSSDRSSSSSSPLL